MRFSSILCLSAIAAVLAGPACPCVIHAQPGPATAGSAAPAPAVPSAPAQATEPGSSAPPRSSEDSPAARSPASDMPQPPAITGETGEPAQPTPTPEPALKAPTSGGSETPADPNAGTTGSPAVPELSVPSPGELGDRLVGDLPPPPEPKAGWTAPTPLITLHGYFRARGELMDHFWLGRPILTAAEKTGGQGPDPFTAFRPYERTISTTNCGSSGSEQDSSILDGAGGNVCKTGALKFANIRFRFSPQLNISEDIRIKTTFDILDNYVLGTGPSSFYGQGRAALGVLPGTTTPTSSLIVPRRVWAEVRNRDLGELRFGLMPDHWGLGMLYNAGNGLDDDYSTDLGRVMVTTKLIGFYLTAAYDFLNEGTTGLNPGGGGPQHDVSQLQDLEQFTFQVVRRVPDEDDEAVLARGDMVLDGGARFQLRHQDAVPTFANDATTGLPTTVQNGLQNIHGTIYTPDVWAQLRYGKFRLGVEAAWVLGQLRNLNGTDSSQKQYVSQLGVAIESELKLLNDKLGLYIYAGGATGDSDVDGLSSDANFIDRAGGSQAAMGSTPVNNGRVSTFRFNPAYRVDLILWRNLMTQVTGAMYVKPGISYDLIKDSFGQLFGARVDLIYSRASSPVQTWGNDPNLGLEIDAQVYWRSADGPNFGDGYHAMLQYGVLFPMKGLNYAGGNLDLSTAQTLRLVLGVSF